MPRLPPEAEENGAHAQEWEANCSMQHATSENAARMLIAGRWTYCRLRNTRGTSTPKKSQIFIIRKKKSSFGNLYSNVDFLIITKNSGGLAAMQMLSLVVLYMSSTLRTVMGAIIFLRPYNSGGFFSPANTKT